MTRWTAAVAAVGLAAVVSAGASTGQASGLDQLGWMAGCWTSSSGGRQTDEQWMRPLGGTMMGMSRTVTGGRTVEWEALMIRQAGADIVYVARPSGQAEATFKMTSASTDEVRFENPEHDFPQRIIYRRLPDGGLHARVEGTTGGKLRSLDFQMKRSDCGGPDPSAR